MRKEYNKLVRDRIPEIIASEGRKYVIETLSEHEYRQALLHKLTEEAEEVKSAPTDKLILEIADLYEVIDALLDTYDISQAKVLYEQQKRKAERGGFQKRIKLLWTD
jgi:predicted house-cleaning noncanonical NTP pyrophosphatase (MazG superfamily)